MYELAPKLVNNFNYIDGHVFVESVNSPEGPSHYLCVCRITLDDILVRRVRQEQSVSLVEGAHVDNLALRNDDVVEVGWSESGRQASAAAEPTDSTPAAEFHYRGIHLVYVFPADAGLTLLAASVPMEEFQEFKRNPEARLQAELESMPELAARLRHGEMVSPVKGTGNIPGYQRIPFGRGWTLVGDAGQIMDPWSGQGIDQASTHAVMLTDALDAWLSEKVSWDNAMIQYHRQRNEFSVKTFESRCTYARDLRPMTIAALQRRGLA